MAGDEVAADGLVVNSHLGQHLGSQRVGYSEDGQHEVILEDGRMAEVLRLLRRPPEDFMHTVGEPR